MALDIQEFAGQIAVSAATGALVAVGWLLKMRNDVNVLAAKVADNREKINNVEVSLTNTISRAMTEMTQIANELRTAVDTARQTMTQFQLEVTKTFMSRQDINALVNATSSNAEKMISNQKDDFQSDIVEIKQQISSLSDKFDTKFDQIIRATFKNG